MPNQCGSLKFELNLRAATIVGLILIVGAAAGVYFLGGLISCSHDIWFLGLLEWLSVVAIGVAAAGVIYCCFRSFVDWISVSDKFMSMPWSSAFGFEPFFVLGRRLDQIFKPPRFSS